MERSCDYCDQPYEAKTKRSRFCSDLCRAMSGKRDKVNVLPIRPEPEQGEPAGEGSVTAAVRAELEEAQRDTSATGRQALDLAKRIDASPEASSAVASLHRELRMTMEVALAASKQANRVDELRDRRLAKARGA